MTNTIKDSPHVSRHKKNKWKVFDHQRSALVKLKSDNQLFNTNFGPNQDKLIWPKEYTIKNLSSNF